MPTGSPFTVKDILKNAEDWGQMLPVQETHVHHGTVLRLHLPNGGVFLSYKLYYFKNPCKQKHHTPKLTRPKVHTTHWTSIRLNRHSEQKLWIVKFSWLRHISTKARSHPQVSFPQDSNLLAFQNLSIATTKFCTSGLYHRHDKIDGT